MRVHPHRTEHALWARVLALLAATVAALLLLASSARAADRIYWANLSANTISWANLDGSGGGDLPINPAALNGPMGLAIDTTTGKLYWSNYGDNNGTTIGVANLDGSDGQILPISGVGVSQPHGVAVDHAANKIYWTNHTDAGESWIGFANLDGSGGGILNTGSATINGPRGLALDKATGLLYFANWNGNTIGFARVDGGGGADLNTGTATVDNPEGVAISPSQNRLYYGNFNLTPDPPHETISYVNLDGSGGADLQTPGATRDEPHGIAIDPTTNRIYWPNFDLDILSWANLDGSGGQDLPTPNATKNGPDLPVLLKTPTGSPTVAAPLRHPSKLRCSGNWSPDMLGSLLYQAPQTISYQWFKGKKAIKGANSSSLRRHSVADYRCRSVGTNAAGSNAATSLPYGLFKVAGEKLNPAAGTASLKIRVPGKGKLSLAGKGVAKDRVRGRGVPGAALGRKVKRGKVNLVVKTKGKAKRKLNRKGAEKVKVKVVYRPKGGLKSTQIKTVKLRKR